MGSSGSGNFSDYTEQKSSNPQDETGGSSGVDKCRQAFETGLEEVGRCFFFLTNESLPPVKTAVVLTFNGIRLAVETQAGEELGYLPTKLNYLKACMAVGVKYIGAINSSSVKPTPSIRVDFYPE